MKTLLKISSFLLMINALITCQEKDPDPSVTLPLTGCDGDLTGTDCQQFFVPEGETLSYPTGTEIKASKGIEINGDIVIDPSTGGDFTITATSGDIVIAGKILVKDTASGNSSGGRYKTGKSGTRIKNGKAADGFTLTLNAKGPNGNIILRKGATLFSGRGQHAYPEKLLSIISSYEGAAGGNGGPIILNAQNGKVKLPDLGNPVTPYQDELFVLGNGGDGANVEIDENLETGNLKVVEVRGGLGGNAGQLIIDALEIEGIPALEKMQTHPDFIYGGKGGQGGNVIWIWFNINKKYTLQEILLHGGDGGEGAKAGGYGGFAIFYAGLTTIGEVGDLVPNIFSYGGDGGDVFASPLPHQSVWGGEGGACGVFGAGGWSGGIDPEGIIFRDGANGGNAFGQGGNGGNILAGCRAYLAVGGDGSFSDQARTALPALFGDPDYLHTYFRVQAGHGGDGYEDCKGCRGGDGGNAGIATAIGGKGGDVLGEAIQSIGGDGGDIWAIVRNYFGNGGNGNPAGKAGAQPSDPPLFDYPGEGGNGTTSGQDGETLGFDLDSNNYGHAIDGQTCGNDLLCKYDEMEVPTGEENCREEGASFFYETTEKTEYSNGKSETIVTIKGAYIEDGCDGYPCFICDRTRIQTITRDGFEPRMYTTNGTGPCQYMNIDPFCTKDGQLFFPAGNSSVSYSNNDTQVTVTFSGCYGDEQAPRTCCQKNGNYYFWGGSEDTCPE